MVTTKMMILIPANQWINDNCSPEKLLPKESLDCIFAIIILWNLFFFHDTKLYFFLKYGQK